MRSSTAPFLPQILDRLAGYTKSNRSVIRGQKELPKKDRDKYLKVALKIVEKMKTEQGREVRYVNSGHVNKYKDSYVPVPPGVYRGKKDNVGAGVEIARFLLKPDFRSTSGVA
jgi:hypothetical protein